MDLKWNQNLTLNYNERSKTVIFVRYTYITKFSYGMCYFVISLIILAKFVICVVYVQ